MNSATNYESRPWTRWWWMGSAVTKTGITQQLTQFWDAGMGGVEISPIYGAKGYEERYIPFLSDKWIEMLGHTIAEAKRLDLGVDLILGTGWPYGGPWVKDADAACHVWVEVFPADGGETVSHKKPDATVLAVTPGADGLKRYALFLAPTGQKVKRASPGGDGSVLDHFSAEAVRRYVEAFDKPFLRLPGGEMVRCIFNDSWEVFGANATPNILTAFERRRGYDLRPYLASLYGDGDPEMVRRVRSDYRETIGDIVREDFLGVWRDWAHEKKAKTRNQAHGSPGNLLDLYAMSDIPETEVFGPARLALAGLKPLADIPPDFGKEEELLLCKMASSAAHVAGKPLCSSESFTWLGEHGKVPLEHAKAEADLLFAMGINHIFFHGTPYSPEDAAWPGWLFYASTHMAPTNPFWRDLPALNAYIARCQAALQAGIPDNDIMLYFPFYDLLAGEQGTSDLLQFLSFHRTGTWLTGNLPAFVQTAHTLWNKGWSYDLVSDRLLSDAVTVQGGKLTAQGGAEYRVLVVAGCELLPPETMERLADLARDGAMVLFVGDLPGDVPGLAHLDTRRERLHTLQESLGPWRVIGSNIRRATVGSGSILVGPNLEMLLAQAAVERETITDAGLEFLRRRRCGTGNERTYFISNPGKEKREDWFTLTHSAASVVIQEPLSGRSGAGAVRQKADGKTEVYLRLEAGESLLLNTLTGKPDAVPWAYLAPAAAGQSLEGPWNVMFIEGGPTLPPARQVPHLSDWTTWPEDKNALCAFSGTARYTLTFDLPAASAEGWELDLGEVCHSARVRLNGENIGTVFARPWRLRLPPNIPKMGNHLEIDVTNLMANRLADLERREGDKWRPFLLVNINYKPFDAAQWEPMPSGLLGPVRLVPLRKTVGV